MLLVAIAPQSMPSALSSLHRWNPVQGAFMGGVPRPGELALHPRCNFRRRRHVVEALRGGRARAPVVTLDCGRPRVRVHAERGAVTRLDGILRYGRPLPCLWHGTCADGFQTIPL